LRWGCGQHFDGIGIVSPWQTNAGNLDHPYPEP